MVLWKRISNIEQVKMDAMRGINLFELVVQEPRKNNLIIVERNRFL